MVEMENVEDIINIEDKENLKANHSECRKLNSGKVVDLINTMLADLENINIEILCNCILEFTKLTQGLGKLATLGFQGIYKSYMYISPY